MSQLGQSVLSRPEPWPVTAYLLCGTPRTGSTLLCGLLESTNMAGHPESYFRSPDERTWANRWRLPRGADGTFNYHDYVRAAIVTGTTPNGVFGARVMWGTLDEIVIKLSSVYPDPAGADLQLLTRAFGGLRFVYVWRADSVAQAVSWARAEQTHFWQDGDERLQVHQPQFDFEQIRILIQIIAEHNSAWRNWFARFRVQPHVVQYEELIADPAGPRQGPSAPPRQGPDTGRDAPGFETLELRDHEQGARSLMERRSNPEKTPERPGSGCAKGPCRPRIRTFD